MIFLPPGFCQGVFCRLSEVAGKGRLKSCVSEVTRSLQSNTSLSRDVGFTATQGLVQSTHPSAEVTTGNAASQARVKVRNPVRSTHWLVLVYFTTAVDIAASCQVPVRHGERRPRREKRRVSTTLTKIKLIHSF